MRSISTLSYWFVEECFLRSVVELLHCYGLRCWCTAWWWWRWWWRCLVPSTEYIYMYVMCFNVNFMYIFSMFILHIYELLLHFVHTYMFNCSWYQGSFVTCNLMYILICTTYLSLVHGDDVLVHDIQEKVQNGRRGCRGWSHSVCRGAGAKLAQPLLLGNSPPGICSGMATSHGLQWPFLDPRGILRAPLLGANLKRDLSWCVFRRAKRAEQPCPLKVSTGYSSLNNPTIFHI